MDAQGQKDLSRATGLAGPTRLPAEWLPALGLPSTCQYPVTSKVWEASNEGVRQARRR